MTSLLEDDSLDGKGRLWYDRAIEGYALYHGNKGLWMTQARMWLEEPDLGAAEIAWDLVDSEHSSRED